MSSALSTYLVTGANRGVGKGIVSILLTKPSTTVIGAVRDPSAASVTALSSLPKATDSRLIIVKIDAAVESDPHSAVAILEKDHGISSIDVVVANAGICHTATPVLSSSTEALGEHFAINTAAPLHLLRAAAPLLKKSTSGRPTFVGISSFVGTISGLDLLADFPAVVAPYGASKAALNWLVRRLHFEEKWLLSFVIHPGLVETDMVSATMPNVDTKAMGSITVETSAGGILGNIDTASRDQTGGTFRNHDGAVLPW